jgi:ubiquinone/menaquinone biosynthesis C-methylase UbiE
VDLVRERIAEIGCGHGMVQRQIEDHFTVEVDGIDPNLAALR